MRLLRNKQQRRNVRMLCLVHHPSRQNSPQRTTLLRLPKQKPQIVNWPLLAWQASISLGVYCVIKMNGRGLIHGWLFGFLVQCLQVGYGVITHQWGFLLSAVPGAAFLEVWIRKLRERRDCVRK